MSGVIKKWGKERSDLKPRSILCTDKGWAQTSENFANFSMADQFTVSAWVRPTAFNAVNTIVFHRVPTSAGAGWLLYLDSSGRPTFSRTSGTGQSIAKRTNAAVPLGRWTSIICTISGPTLAEFDIWINDIAQAYTTLFNTTTYDITHTSPLTIGGWYPASDYRFNGRLTAVGIWDRALDSTDRAIVFEARNDYVEAAATAPIGWFSGYDGTREIIPNQAGGSVYLEPSHARHRYSEKNPTCLPDVPVVSLADPVAGYTLPKTGSGTPVTVCAPDKICGTTMVSNAEFVYPTDATLRNAFLATHTTSVMARVSTLSHDHFMMAYAHSASDLSSARNFLASLIIRQASGLAYSWEYNVGVNVDFNSGWFPEVGKWYLFSVRMTIGATTICELLADGIVVAVSGPLTNANGGTDSFLRFGGGGNSGSEHTGATAFADISSVARSNDYLKNLRRHGRAWGQDSDTVMRLVPQIA